jgi:hypothetical protein
MNDSKSDMNVFFVISNITWIVAESYIIENNIKNAILLHPKRFKPSNSKLRCFYYPYYDEKVEYNQLGKNIFKKKKHVSEIKRFFNGIVNGANFIFYAPHFYYNSLRVIIESPSCTNYYYIEEGSLSFQSIDSVKKLMPDINLSIFERLGFGFERMEAFPDLSKNAICITNGAFPFIKEKHVVCLDVLKCLINDRTVSIDLSDKAVLIFDPCVENKIIKIEKYLVSIIRSIEFIKQKGYKKIYFKFHPHQFLFNYIDYFRMYLSNTAFGIDFVELHHEFSLELSFLCSKNILLVHTISSLGFYCRLYSHNSYSNAGFLIDDLAYKERYFDKVNDLFNFAMIPTND